MTTTIKYFKTNRGLAVIILFFFLSRYLFLNLGLKADFSHLPHMWQLLNPDLLLNDYFKSLLYLHFQPPVWNSIYGIFVKLIGTDYEDLSDVLNLFNLACSLLITIYFYFLCKEFELNNFKIYILFILFIGFSPSLLMYENFIHYTNLTVLFFLIISYSVLRFSKKPNLRNEIKIYFFLILLMYTWSAFSHPFILIVFGFILYLIREDKKYISIILLAIVIFISSLTSIKNKYYFNYFSSSYGPGLGLMQVLKRYDYKYPLCSFELADIPSHEKIYISENPNKNFSHPSIIGKKSKWNSIAFIHRSKSCLPVSLNLIKNDPINYIQKVKFNLISSHGHFAFDFGQKPKNWDNIFGFFDDMKSNDITNFLKVRTLQTYHLIFHIFFIFIIIKLLLNLNKKNTLNLSIVGIYYLYAWIIFVSHVGTGFEFERMRHTGHALHIIFFILLIKNNFNIFYIIKKK